jgi:hypothetical protein
MAICEPSLNIGMDNELFKQKLSEVSNWKLPEINVNDINKATKGRGRKSKESEYQEEHEQVFLEMFEGVNPTFPPQLVDLKVQAVDCEDCGKHCPNGRQLESKFYTTNDKPHWRKKCLTCKHWENPLTGKFDIDNGTESSFAWTDFLRDTKQIYQTRKNKAREAKEHKEESDNCVIRKYPDTMRPL